MRGDRPATPQRRRRRESAAPHARGSTLQVRKGLKAEVGCPACAGIDPQRSKLGAPPLRLPRMRGDRPSAGVMSFGAFAAAPHARGSTRRRGTAALRLDGCPACAGIDPRRTSARRASARLPRMRGDRPPRPTPRWSPRWAAPHARGSTLAEGLGARGARGCPACAGIDPSGPPRITRCSRLPRMRGDRPCAETRRGKVGAAAPHARGSTCTVGDRGR